MNGSRDRIIICLNSESGESVEKTMLVRTQPSTWKNISQPIILPISIHSAFHEGEEGNYKFTAYLCIIKKYTNNVSILMAEGAHINVLSLKYGGNVNAALNKCRNDAEILLNRFKDVLSGCTILFWDDFVKKTYFTINLLMM